MPNKGQTDRKGHRGPRIISLALLASGAAVAITAMIWHDASRLKPQGTPHAVELAQAALNELGYGWARVSMRGATVHLTGLAPDDSARVMAYAATRQALRPLMGKDATVDAIRSHLALDVGAEPLDGHRIEGTPPLDVAALAPPPMPLIHRDSEAAVAADEGHETTTQLQRDDEEAARAANFVPTAGAADETVGRATAAATIAQGPAANLSVSDHGDAPAPPTVRTVTIETSAVDKPETPVPATATAPASATPPIHSADSCADAFANALSSATVNFEKDSATVQRESRPLLDQLASIAKRCKDYRLVVEGHTDLTGSPSHNLLLSRRRAEIVRWALIDRGIDMDHITSEGYGSSRPIERSTSDAANARNRRIAITVREPAPKTTANR